MIKKDIVTFLLLCFAGFLLFLIGYLIGLKTLSEFQLDIIQKVLSSFGAFSLIIAIVNYFYKKQQDLTAAAIDQVTFFREKILLEWIHTSKAFLKKNSSFLFPSIHIEKHIISDLMQRDSSNFTNQLLIFFNPETAKIDDTILDLHISLLNMLEEFALKVKNLNTIENSALIPLHVAFIELIEQNAAALFFVRDIMTETQTYNTILWLYSIWVNKIVRPKIIENLQKYALITQK